MKLIKLIALSTLAVAALSGCGEKKASETTQTVEAKKFKWRLVTTWPKNFPGLGMAPEKFAKLVNEMSNGRLHVTVYGAGELVPGSEVFTTVSEGKVAEIGHGAAYYWKGIIPAAQIFGAVPFGMNAQELNAWVFHDDGLKLWEELYKPFGVVPFPGGNTGVQPAGWFNKEINSLDDLKGLKMRIPGMGGEVLKKVGGVPVSLPGGELFTSLQSGAIDATEWVGPYNDLSFGLHKAAKYYYHTGWHEPGTLLEFVINEKAYQELPKDLQVIVKSAMRVVHQDLSAEYTARNQEALVSLVEKHNVQLRQLSPEVVAALKAASDQTLEAMANADPQLKKVWDDYQAFYATVRDYHDKSEKEYYLNR